MVALSYHISFVYSVIRITKNNHRRKYIHIYHNFPSLSSIDSRCPRGWPNLPQGGAGWVSLTYLFILAIMTKLWYKIDIRLFGNVNIMLKFILKQIWGKFLKKCSNKRQNSFFWLNLPHPPIYDKLTGQLDPGDFTVQWSRRFNLPYHR